MDLDDQQQYVIHITHFGILTSIPSEWLISASSHPIDDGEDELLNGILDRLEKQKEAAGSGSQPGSTVEMSQLIVDYCIETYERKPGALDEGRPEDCRLTGFPSIRQVFSKAINSIVCQPVYENRYVTGANMHIRQGVKRSYPKNSMM